MIKENGQKKISKNLFLGKMGQKWTKIWLKLKKMANIANFAPKEIG